MIECGREIGERTQNGNVGSRHDRELERFDAPEGVNDRTHIERIGKHQTAEAQLTAQQSSHGLR